MAKYVICKKCKKLIEYTPVIKHEGGTSYTSMVCPKCGYTETISENHIHYGDDARR